MEEAKDNFFFIKIFLFSFNHHFVLGWVDDLTYTYRQNVFTEDCSAKCVFVGIDFVKIFERCSIIESPDCTTT